MVGLLLILILIIYTFIISYDLFKTAKSVYVSGLSYNLEGGNVSVSSEISGENSGLFPVKIIIDNSTLDFKPNVIYSKRVYFYENLTDISKEGWPLKNISVNKNISIIIPSNLFSIKTDINEHYDLGAPFYGFRVINSSLIHSNRTSKLYGIRVSFRDYLNYDIYKIDNYEPIIEILYDNSTVGEIKNVTLVYNNDYTYNGIIELPSNVNEANLTFVLPVVNIRWEEYNVTVN